MTTTVKTRPALAERQRECLEDLLDGPVSRIEDANARLGMARFGRNGTRGHSHTEVWSLLAKGYVTVERDGQDHIMAVAITDKGRKALGAA